MIRFRLRMLVTIMIGAFTTFTMLLYATSENAGCDSASSVFCYYVYKDEEPGGLVYRKGKSGSNQFKHFKLISNEKVFDVKRRTTERFANLRAPTPSKNVTAKKNVVRVRWTTSSSVVRAASLAPRSMAVTRKRIYNGNNGDGYIRIKLNVESLLHRKLNVSWTDNTFNYYAERQRNLHHNCRHYHNVSDVLKVKASQLDHLLIDEKRKILFCYVPKVACTNWKRIFMWLTGKVSNISEIVHIPSHFVHSRSHFTRLQNYSQKAVNTILRDYVKFIFVRNPFERLLSAFHNKLEQHYNSSKYFQVRFGKYIIRKFRKNPTNDSLARGDDVTFSEFIDYLISSESHAYNEHWQTVTNLCHPCFVNYDLIGKYETLVQDSNFVLRYLKMNYSFPVFDKPSRTASIMKKYFSTLGRDVIRKLYKIYEMDFKLFGYDLSNTLDWLNGS